MKKLLIAFALLMSTMFVSCNGSSIATTDTVDSTEVVTDSVDSIADSIAVDTVTIDTVM